MVLVQVTAALSEPGSGPFLWALGIGQPFSLGKAQGNKCCTMFLRSLVGRDCGVTNGVWDDSLLGVSPGVVSFADPLFLAGWREPEWGTGHVHGGSQVDSALMPL